MATSLTTNDIQDLVKGTQRRLGRMKFQQVAQELQRYEIFTKWWKNEKIVESDGIGLQYNLMARLSGNARHVGINDEDNTTITDVMEQLQVNWRYARASYGFNYYETLQNRGESLIFDIMKPRRADAMISLAAELELKAWSCPTSANTVDPYGIPYWIVKNATPGFNGGLPSDHSTIAGISLTAAPKFKNYTFGYAAVSKGDLVSKLRVAHRLCQWVSPVTIEDYRRGSGTKMRWYVNNDTLTKIEDVGEAQNENLGRDVASMDGTITFRSLPIIWIPQLDADTTNPVYGLDHSTFWPVILKGAFLLERDVIQDPNKSLWYYVPIESAYNYVCVDRRRNIVGYVN